VFKQISEKEACEDKMTKRLAHNRRSLHSWFILGEDIPRSTGTCINLVTLMGVVTWPCGKLESKGWWILWWVDHRGEKVDWYRTWFIATTGLIKLMDELLKWQ
jgi:hypothetical protein